MPQCQEPRLYHQTTTIMQVMFPHLFTRFNLWCHLHANVKFLGTYLQVVLAVHYESVAEQVSHDYQVGVFAFHTHTVHTQELRQKGTAMTFDNVLGKKKKKTKKQVQI